MCQLDVNTILAQTEKDVSQSGKGLLTILHYEYVRRQKDPLDEKYMDKCVTIVKMKMFASLLENPDKCGFTRFPLNLFQT